MCHSVLPTVGITRVHEQYCVIARKGYAMLCNGMQWYAMLDNTVKVDNNIAL